LGDDKTIADIAHKHDVHPNQVTDWRRQLLERAATVFGAAAVTDRRNGARDVRRNGASF
jgi:transposase-like protein